MTDKEAIEMNEGLLDWMDADSRKGARMREALMIAIAALKEKADRITCEKCSNYTEEGTCDLLNDLRFAPDDFCSFGEPKDGINCSDRCENKDVFCFYCSRNYEDMYKQKEEG